MRVRGYIFYLCSFVGSRSRSPLSSSVAILQCLFTFIIIIFYSSSRRVLRHIVGRLLTQCSHYSPDTFSPSTYYIHCKYSTHYTYSVLPIHLYVYLYIHKFYSHTYKHIHTHIQVHTPDYQGKRVCLFSIRFLLLFSPVHFCIIYRYTFHRMYVYCVYVHVYVYPRSLLTSYFKSSEEEQNR